jgi:spermidine synthase
MNARLLNFNNYTETAISLTAPFESKAVYTDAFQLGRIFRADVQRVLIIGGGGGVGARKFVADDPNVVVDLVEIDPVVIGLGQQYFYLQNDERLRVHAEDGREFVRNATEKYDLVVLDAYTIGGQIPFHLTTQEFMRELKSILNPGGVVLANINSALEGPRSRVLRAEHKTIASVFAEVYLFPLSGARGGHSDPAFLNSRRNVILVATVEKQSLTQDQIAAIADRLAADGVVKVKSFTEHARQLFTSAVNTDDVPLLTDDYAPVDTMLF